MPIVGKTVMSAYEKLACVVERVVTSKSITSIHKEDLSQALSGLNSAIERDNGKVVCECTTPHGMCDTSDCPVCRGAGMRKVLDW